MYGTAIKSITAREAYSDRTRAAVHVTVTTENGSVGKGTCSPGISVGSYEIESLYDGDDRFAGYGFRKAADNINKLIAPKLIGLDAANQTACDAAILELGKSVIGGIASAALSTAILNAGANALKIPLYEHIGGVRAFTLPVPGVTVATGSTRYNGPVNAGYRPTYSFVAYDFDTFTEASTALWEVYMDWSDYIKDNLGIKMQPTAGMAIPQGKLKDDYQLWDMMADVINKAGFIDKIGIQVDMAANSFYNRETMMYEGLFSHTPKSREDLIGLVEKMAKDYPFVIIEDPLFEDDFEGFAEITKKVDIEIIGDDLLATNPDRLRKAIQMKAGNAIRIVTGQIGTVTEAMEVVQLAVENCFGISPCSARGEDITICDYAVGYNAGTIRENGLGYYGNRLLQIEKELGTRARFFGKAGITGSRFSI
ncbi:MAG: enolase C-terminal domain-like protein [Acetivibrionales bacterium]|jgi:enolase